MFCYQCEQASNGKGCTKTGVCGKDPELSSLQDLLIYSMKGLSLVAVEGRKHGVVDQEVNLFLTKGLFSTLTNVDFDPRRFETLIQKSVALREGLKAKVKAAGGRADFTHGSASYKPAATIEALVKQGREVRERVPDLAINPDIQ
jgi:hydroxylamine reductase